MTTQGDRLKNIRIILSMTQEAFGAELGISKQYYSNIETNRTTLNNDKLVLLFKEFNVNLNYLIGGVGFPFNEREPVENTELTAQIEKILDEKLKQRGLI